MSLIATLFQYVFNKGAARLVGVVYFLALFLVSIIKFFSPSITPEQVTLFSLLFPRM